MVSAALAVGRCQSAPSSRSDPRPHPHLSRNCGRASVRGAGKARQSTLPSSPHSRGGVSDSIAPHHRRLHWVGGPDLVTFSKIGSGRSRSTPPRHAHALGPRRDRHRPARPSESAPSPPAALPARSLRRRDVPGARCLASTTLMFESVPFLAGASNREPRCMLVRLSRVRNRSTRA